MQNKEKKRKKKEINPSPREVFGAELLSSRRMKEGEESETTSAGSFLVGGQTHGRVARIDVAMGGSA
jgi:hypothetical protein